MNRFVIARAAAAMREVLPNGRSGKVRRPTRIGTLELERANGLVSVYLELEDRPPSLDEMTLVCELFDVPVGTEPVYFTRRQRKLSTGRLATFYVGRVTWVEA